jgi:hypothetical protein
MENLISCKAVKCSNKILKGEIDKFGTPLIICWKHASSHCHKCGEEKGNKNAWKHECYFCWKKENGIEEKKPQTKKTNKTLDDYFFED